MLLNRCLTIKYLHIFPDDDQLLTATKLLGILRELWASSAFSRGLGSVVAVNLCLECITLLLFWAIWEVLLCTGLRRRVGRWMLTVE